MGNLKELAGKKALVTGATSGLGLVMATALAEAKAEIAGKFQLLPLP